MERCMSKRNILLSYRSYPRPVYISIRNALGGYMGSRIRGKQIHGLSLIFAGEHLSRYLNPLSIMEAFEFKPYQELFPEGEDSHIDG